MAQRKNEDSPWKVMLKENFPAAIEFFFPAIAAVIDWSVLPEFLDQEFQQLSPNAAIGKRITDQLVKVRRLGGADLFLLLHLEVQARKDESFAERMLIYAIRIYDRFGQFATSLAILCDGDENWRPQDCGLESPGSSLAFQFSMVKLLDYQSRMAELQASRNLFSVVVMTHLRTRETDKDLQRRKEWKFSLMRGLYEAGYNREEILKLYRFLDWIMILPEELNRSFWDELQAYEEGKKMTYVTSVERIGRENGSRSLILKQLNYRFGKLSEEISGQINTLSIAKIESLSQALFDFQSSEDLNNWLKNQ
jgi:Domain of unknown function (DUF4351)